MRREGGVSIVLTDAQVAQVARETSHERQGMASLLRTFDDPRSLAGAIAAHSEGAQVSRSVLRALLVLAAFPTDGIFRALADVSKELGYNPSTTHRYVSTWLAIGLLEQDPKSRRYRRASSAAPSAYANGRATKGPMTRKSRRTGS